MAKRSYPAQQAWLGKDYATMPHGKKLLIVGESHHHPVDCREVKCEWCEAREQGEMTRYAVDSLGIKGKHPFYRKVRELLSEKGRDPAEFWHSVSYCNALSFVFDKPGDPVPERARLNPNCHRAIADLLNKLEPSRVLVLGKANWRYFPSDDPAGLRQVLETRPEEKFRLSLGSISETDGNAYWYRTRDGEWILTAGIYHPRYLMGSRFQEARKVVGLLMTGKFKEPTKGYPSSSF